MLSLLSARRHERTGYEIYGAAVRAARNPVFFAELAVPDTLDGRFDLVGLFAALAIRRLRLLPAPGPNLAQAVFDAMFADMDFNLRELGVGDLSLPRKMKAMWEAFHGRAIAYEAPLADADAGGLALALARNVWRGALPAEAAAPALLAREALRQDAHLAAFGIKDWQAGRAAFAPVPLTFLPDAA